MGIDNEQYYGFIASEFIREKITLHTKQELPYSAAVEIDLFKEDEAKNLIRITATINVEKDSQKAIMIGKKGAMLKKIGTMAPISRSCMRRCVTARATRNGSQM